MTAGQSLEKQIISDRWTAIVVLSGKIFLNCCVAFDQQYSFNDDSIFSFLWGLQKNYYIQVKVYRSGVQLVISSSADSSVLVHSPLLRATKDKTWGPLFSLFVYIGGAACIFGFGRIRKYWDLIYVLFTSLCFSYLEGRKSGTEFGLYHLAVLCKIILVDFVFAVYFLSAATG